MSGNDGINFSEKLARDVKTATGLVLGNRGNETVQAFGRTNVRQTRFYKAPGGGIAAPSNSTTPSSATCTLMKWNAAGTALEVTNTTETVYSFSAYAADEVFQAKQVGGKIFADKSGGESMPDFAVVDFAYTTAGDGLATFSNLFTTDEAVIEVDPFRFTAEGDFIYFVEGWMEYDFPIELEYKRVQMGVTSFTSVSAGASSSQTINLGYSFTPSYPYVTATIAHPSFSPWSGAGIPILSVDTEAASSFKLYLHNQHATTATGTVRVQWIAHELDAKYEMLQASMLKADVRFQSADTAAHEEIEVWGTDRIFDGTTPDDFKVPFCFNGWSTVTSAATSRELQLKVTRNAGTGGAVTNILSVNGTITVIKADGITNDYVAEAP